MQQTLKDTTRPTKTKVAKGSLWTRVLACATCACSLLVVGVSGASADPCPNEALRYGYGSRLPDCRAYEQATPVEKDGSNPLSTYNTVQAAVAGGGITFFSQSGVPGATGAGNSPVFMASRGAEGWTAQGLLPPAKGGQLTSTLLGWTPSLTEAFGLETQLGPPLTQPLMARDTSDGTVTTIASPSEARYAFAGASADGMEVFFEARKAQLTPEAAANKFNLYVWDRSTGLVSLVGMLPSAACGSPPCAPAGGSFAGPYDWWNEEETSGGASVGYFVQAEHAVSASGQKAYFTAGETGQIYLRENPASVSAVTLQVSASQKTNGAGTGGADPSGPKPAVFMTATPDGARAFFTSAEELTNDANTGTGDEGNDLYRYEPKSGALADLTPDSSDTAGAEVKGVIGVSDDGSYAYFVANGDLDGAGPATKGDCSGPDEAQTGECSLYLWHNGVINFIAKVNVSGSLSAGGGESDAANWLPRRTLLSGGSDAVNTGRVSADGHVLLFRSQNQLSGYENGGTPEFYRYVSQTGLVNCVSCSSLHVRPVDAPSLQAKTSFLGTAGPAAMETRNLSASGDQFFFETFDSLLPGDTNGATDVYEWEADGAGSCESSADEGGCLYLLSTGTSPDPSSFADASASGDEAFLFTEQSLVGQDQDQLVDIYDARVDGGLPIQNPPPLSACVGEECRTPLSVPPPQPFAASVTLSGRGNQIPGKRVSTRARTVRRTVRRTIRSASFTVIVSAPARGTISISGAGVRGAGRSVAGAGSYHLRVQLTASERRLLARRHALKLTLRLVYTPAAAAGRRAGK